jgi:hypothetical protein
VAEQAALSFADLLRRLRDEPLLTQEELAEAARVGKAAFAGHAAHRLADSFPAGAGRPATDLTVVRTS